MTDRTNPEALRAACQAFVDMIHTVEGRCMAADGPVTLTTEEVREDELRAVYVACTAALAGAPAAAGDAPLDDVDRRAVRALAASMVAGWLTASGERSPPPSRVAELMPMAVTNARHLLGMADYVMRFPS